MRDLLQREIDHEQLLESVRQRLSRSPSLLFVRVVKFACAAVTRRMREQGPSFDPRIDLALDENSQILEAEDNGYGFTSAELTQPTSKRTGGETSGTHSGYRQPSIFSFCERLKLLSVCHSVEVYTTSAAKPELGWLYRSRSLHALAIEEAPKREIGSRLTLRFKPDFSELIDQESLFILLRQYCALVPFPIYFNGLSLFASRPPIFWRDPVGRSFPTDHEVHGHAWVTYLHRHSPLCILPLHRQGAGAPQGFFWLAVPNVRPELSWRKVRLYCEGMLVSDPDLTLLPPHSDFIGAIVEVPSGGLEDAHGGGDTYLNHAWLNLEVRKGLADAMAELAASRPKIWREVMWYHSEHLSMMMLSDSLFFEALKEQLLVPTTRGMLPLPEIARASGGKIYLICESMLASPYAIRIHDRAPAVLSRSFHIRAICARYAAGSEIDLEELQLPQFRRYLNNNRPRSARLRQIFEPLSRRNNRLVMARFLPVEMPLLVVPGDGRRAKRRFGIGRSLPVGSVPPLRIAGLGLTRNTESSETVFINLNNSTVRGAIKGTTEVRQGLLALLNVFLAIDALHAAAPGVWECSQGTFDRASAVILSQEIRPTPQG